MSWVGAWLGAPSAASAPSTPTPPPLVEVDVEHAEIEVVDYVAHALDRLPQQHRGSE